VYVPKIPSLRAYANELKVSDADGQYFDCKNPSKVDVGVSWTECINGVATTTGQSYNFKKFGGEDKICVRANGSARTNGFFSDVGTAEDCADKSVRGKKTSRFQL
jgi:hypothetical protein